MRHRYSGVNRDAARPAPITQAVVRLLGETSLLRVEGRPVDPRGATNAKTAPVVIGEMLGTLEGVQWGVVFAAASIQLLPVLALVVVLQRFIVTGLIAGAVKH